MVSQKLRNSQGLTLIEVMISLALVSIVFIAIATAFDLGIKSARHGERNAAASAAVDALEADLRVMAMYDVTRVTTVLYHGETITMYPSGTSFCAEIEHGPSSCATPSSTNPVSGAVVFTVQSNTPTSARSALIGLTYTDPAGGTGSVTIPVRQMGVDTTGCDLANGTTTNCAAVDGGN